MNGSKPNGPPGNRRTPRRRHSIVAARRFLSPHPDPLPRGEGTASIAQWKADGCGLVTGQRRIHPLPKYVFSVFDECFPLPARDERGEGQGGGSPNFTRRCSHLSLALSSLSGGEGEENSATLNAYIPKGEGRGGGKRREHPPA